MKQSIKTLKQNDEPPVHQIGKKKKYITLTVLTANTVNYKTQ